MTQEKQSLQIKIVKGKAFELRKDRTYLVLLPRHIDPKDPGLRNAFERLFGEVKGVKGVVIFLNNPEELKMYEIKGEVK